MKLTWYVHHKFSFANSKVCGQGFPVTCRAQADLNSCFLFYEKALIVLETSAIPHLCGGEDWLGYGFCALPRKTHGLKQLL